MGVGVVSELAFAAHLEILHLLKRALLSGQGTGWNCTAKGDLHLEKTNLEIIV